MLVLGMMANTFLQLYDDSQHRQFQNIINFQRVASMRVLLAWYVQPECRSDAIKEIRVNKQRMRYWM